MDERATGDGEGSASTSDRRRTVLDGVSEGVVVVDNDWRIRRANARATKLLGVDGDEGDDLRTAFPESVAETFRRRFADDADPAAVEFEEYYPDVEAWFSVRVCPLDGSGPPAAAVYVRDVTGRRERKRALDAREDELATLDRIVNIVGDLVRSLSAATDREDVERTVVEALADDPLYEFAWVGRRPVADDGLEHRTAAGTGDGALDAVVESSSAAGPVPGSGTETDEGGTEDDALQIDPDPGPGTNKRTDPDDVRTLEATALETGAVTASRRLAEERSLPEDVRRAAFARGLQSGLAVPIAHGDTVFGVLGVYTDREDAFGAPERVGFATLGETAGLALATARRRRLLLSDTVVELTISVGARRDPFAVAAADLGCRLEVTGVVPVGDELRCYVAVDGATPTAARDALADAAGANATVTLGRVVDGPDGDDDDENGGERDPTGLFEVTIAGETTVSALADRGTTVRSAVFETGDGEVVAEVPPDADVRSIVEAVTAAVPGTELTAKREVERDVETAGEFRRDLRERLTDRQYTALSTAFLAGYFESPRDSTTREVAASLDITSPTLNYHLRAAQRKLVDAFLGDGAGTGHDRIRDDV
jgi:PAS domain S-box-containing protein